MSDAGARLNDIIAVLKWLRFMIDFEAADEITKRKEGADTWLARWFDVVKEAKADEKKRKRR